MIWIGVLAVQSSFFEISTGAGIRAGSVPFPAQHVDRAYRFETTLPGSGEGMGAVARVKVRMGEELRHVWIPHVSPYASTVIGDHSFRSPAFVFADGKQAVAFIPDVDDVRDIQNQGLRVWMDYDHPKREMQVAVGDYRVGPFHVAYQPVPVKYQGQKVQLRMHVLSSTKKEDLANPYGIVARELWSRWGHEGYAKGGSQRAAFSTYAGHVTNWAFAPEPKGWGDTVWQEFTINGKACGAPAFIVDVAQHPSVPLDKRRWREQRSVWNQAWFSTQRTANGLLRYARQIGSPELEKRARLMTQVALSAPQTDGLFPAVYTAGGGGYSLYKDNPGWEKGRWTNSDRRPPGVSDQAVHILDASFTARLLLEWHDLNPGETEAFEYVRRYVDRLIQLMRPDGSFPGWVLPNGDVPTLLASGPESAMSAALLAEFAKRVSDEKRYRNKAAAAIVYVIKGPVPEARWEDFETYFSCSRWGEDRIGQKVARNGVYKSNTFSPFWCAEACMAYYKLMGAEEILAIGRRCLDELSLYQQVWEPPTIPAPTHGGFGVMNADGEWNDSRQSLFAPLYLEYYKATGEPEYFERGVSALRSSFAMMYCPENAQVKGAYEKAHPFFGAESYGFMMENIAHGGPGPNPIGPFTIFTWGNGAALEAAAKVHDSFGQVYVDAKRGKAFGVDGLAASFSGGRVEVVDRYARSEVEVRFADGKRERVKLVGGKTLFAVR